MLRFGLITLLALQFFFVSCEKETEVIHGNSAPPDFTVTEAEYRQYVNRCYIQVQGTEPDSQSLISSMNMLKAAGFSAASRMQFLDNLFNTTAYKWQVFNTARQDYLNNTDTVDIRNQITLFTILSNDSNYILLWSFLDYEIDRLQLLIDAGTLYAAGTIHIRELHKRFINNWFYDQINMGSANFVIASFGQFMNRNPLAQELSAGVSMIDGNNSILFLTAGSSKDDYLNIFFNSYNYEEGAVVGFYRRYLNRDPDSEEMANATQKFHLSGDYEQIQKDILATDEFAAQ